MRDKKIKHLGQICKGPTISRSEIEELRMTLQAMPDLEGAQTLLKSVSGDTRLKILILLHQIEELCVCDIADILDTTVSAVSHQLGRLKTLELVKTNRDAQTIYYSLTNKREIGSILEALELI